MFVGLRREVRSLPPPHSSIDCAPPRVPGWCQVLAISQWAPRASAVLLNPRPRQQDHMAGVGEQQSWEEPRWPPWLTLRSSGGRTPSSPTWGRESGQWGRWRGASVGSAFGQGPARPQPCGW